MLGMLHMQRVLPELPACKINCMGQASMQIYLHHMNYVQLKLRLMMLQWTLIE